MTVCQDLSMEREHFRTHMHREYLKLLHNVSALRKVRMGKCRNRMAVGSVALDVLHNALILKREQKINLL